MTDAEKIARLEELVVFLARGILAHEYSKDLCAGYVEDVIERVSYKDFDVAINWVKRANDEQ